MSVDRSAIVALVLFGLLGLGFAATIEHLRKPLPLPPPTEVPPEFKGPELAPPPRELKAQAPTLYFSVAATGLLVEEIERTVAMPLERAFMELAGIDSVQSRIRQGSCRLTLAFAKGREFHLARAEAANLATGMAAHLPDGASPPRLEARAPHELPVL